VRALIFALLLLAIEGLALSLAEVVERWKR